MQKGDKDKRRRVRETKCVQLKVTNFPLSKYIFFPSFPAYFGSDIESLKGAEYITEPFKHDSL